MKGVARHDRWIQIFLPVITNLRVKPLVVRIPVQIDAEELKKLAKEKQLLTRPS